MSLCLVNGALADDREVTGPPRGLKPPQVIVTQPADSPQRDFISVDDRPGMQDGGIQIGTLSKAGEATTGLLGQSSGGFGPDLWRGSDRQILETLLSRLPMGGASPAMTDLSRRLLLTTAGFPVGRTEGVSFNAIRLDRLLAAGLIDDALDLANQIQQTDRSADLSRLQAETALLLGRDTDACETATQPAINRDQVFWLKLRATCFALADEAAAADLTVDLIRERDPSDTTFFALLMRLTTGADLEVPIPSVLTALHIALYGAVGLTPSTDMMANAAAGSARAVMARESFNTDTRLRAAERLLAAGAIDPQLVVDLFDTLPFTSDDLSGALSQARTNPDPTSSALLYRAAKGLTVPAAQTEAWSALFDVAERRGVYVAMAPVYWSTLKGLQPSEPFAGLALHMVRLALLNGDNAAALAWHDFGRLSTQVAATELRDIRLMMAVTAVPAQIGWLAEEPLVWLDRLNNGAQDIAALADQIAILEHLGRPVSQLVRARLLDEPFSRAVQAPSPIVLAQLDDAIASRRLGETVTLSLIALGRAGPSQASPQTVWDTAAALKIFGLEAEATALLVEAVLAAQLRT